MKIDLGILTLEDSLSRVEVCKRRRHPIRQANARGVLHQRRKSPVRIGESMVREFRSGAEPQTVIVTSVGLLEVFCGELRFNRVTGRQENRSGRLHNNEWESYFAPYSQIRPRIEGIDP